MWDPPRSGDAVWCDWAFGTARLDRTAPTGRASPALSHYYNGLAGSPSQTDHPATVHQNRMEETGIPMNFVLARLLTCLYPRRWRERYGAEFEALLQTGRGGLRTSANVAWSALCEHIFPTQGGKIDQHTPSFGAILKQPSAFLPMAMSLTALAVVVGHVAMFGAVRETDEGAAAHIWQLLMAVQIPVVVSFAIKWLPRAPRQTLYILAQQAGAALASCSAVFFFNLG
jgi:hypothetical protein